MENDPRYVPVGQALPDTLPPLNRADGMRYAQRLVKKFGKLGLGSPNQTRAASLYDWRITDGRRVWISTRPTRRDNHHKGWGRLIHDVSHIVFAARHPSFRTHDGGHATLEREIAEYVVRKGWLTPAPRKHEPDPVDRKKVRQHRLLVRLKRWESKRKRAETALRKLRHSLRRIERSLQHGARADGTQPERG